MDCKSSRVDYFLHFIVPYSFYFFFFFGSQCWCHVKRVYELSSANFVPSTTVEMAHRVLVNFVLTGASVFGRAFTEAYRQAAKASSAPAAGAARKATSIGGIPVDEALKIMDLERNELTVNKIDEKYKYLFDVNSKEKGNSFFLQSKVYYAMDTLRKELEYLEKLKNMKEDPQKN